MSPNAINKIVEKCVECASTKIFVRKTRQDGVRVSMCYECHYKSDDFKKIREMDEMYRKWREPC